MHRITLLTLALAFAPASLTAQQPTTTTTPHDSVRGAIRAVDVSARTVEVAAGVGLALTVLRLQVPAGVPITDREGTNPTTIGLAMLKPGDVVRATFGGPRTALVAYRIERVGRMGSTP
jgi:hypothetical protein